MQVLSLFLHLETSLSLTFFLSTDDKMVSQGETNASAAGEQTTQGPQ